MTYGPDAQTYGITCDVQVQVKDRSEGVTLASSLRR